MALADPQVSVDPALVFDVIRHVASLGYEEHQDWLAWPLRTRLADDIPDDMIEIILGRAMRAISPIYDTWQETEDHGPYYGGDIFAAGLNSARGQSALILGDLILHDTTSQRTALVTPSLPQLAEDPVVAVRCCVAHVLAACLHHARAEAIAAFPHSITADDRLLATRQVLDLMTYIGFGEPEIVEPVIVRTTLGSAGIPRFVRPEVGWRPSPDWTSALATC